MQVFGVGETAGEAPSGRGHFDSIRRPRILISEGTVEGSYGENGNGTERPSSALAYHPQSFDTRAP